MIRYILLVNVYSVLLCLLYAVYLRNTTYYSWSRFYLLVSVIIAALVPFISIEQWLPKETTRNIIATSLPVVWV